MKTQPAIRFQSLPTDYASLCGVLLPRPIHDDVGHHNTLEVADSLAGFEDQMTTDQHDYFDLLCELIEKYEARAATSAKLGSTALLKHLLNEHGLSGAGLSRILGKATSLGPMILRGERNITADHAMCLGKYFGLRPDLFLREG